MTLSPFSLHLAPRMRRLEQRDQYPTVRWAAPPARLRALCAEAPDPGTPYAPQTVAGSFPPDSAQGDWRVRPAVDVAAGSPPRDAGAPAALLSRPAPLAWAPAVPGWLLVARVPLGVVPDGLLAARSPHPSPSRAAAGRLASQAMPAAAAARPGAQERRAVDSRPVAPPDVCSTAEVLSRPRPVAWAPAVPGWLLVARVPLGVVPDGLWAARSPHPSPSPAAAGRLASRWCRRLHGSGRGRRGSGRRWRWCLPGDGRHALRTLPLLRPLRAGLLLRRCRRLHGRGRGRRGCRRGAGYLRLAARLRGVWRVTAGAPSDPFSGRRGPRLPGGEGGRVISAVGRSTLLCPRGGRGRTEAGSGC